MTATAAADSEKAYASAASNSAPSAADPGGSRVPPKISWNCRGATWPHCRPGKRKSFSALKAPLFQAVFSRPRFHGTWRLFWTIFPRAFSENAAETFNEFPRTSAAFRRKKRCPRPFRVALSQEAKPAPRLDNIRESALGGNRHFRAAAWDALKCRNPSWPIPERL